MVIDRVVPVPSVYKVNRPGGLLAALIPTAIDRYVIIDIDLRRGPLRVPVQFRAAGTKCDVHPGRQSVIAIASPVAIVSAAISILGCPDSGAADIARGTVPPCVSVRDSDNEYH